MTKPNGKQQLYLHYVPHNVFEGKTYKYILTGLDIASRYMITRALRAKKAREAAFALEAINRNVGVFKQRKLFQCEYGSELKMMRQSCLKDTI